MSQPPKERDRHSRKRKVSQASASEPVITTNNSEPTAKRNKRGIPTPAIDPSRLTKAPAQQPAEQPVSTKKKKPKHLSRKLAQAQESSDLQTLQTLQTQLEELDALKVDRANKWEALCQKLVGPEKWDQEKFDQLVTVGLNKKKLLAALGVEESEEKKAVKHKKKSKSRVSNRKVISREKKRRATTPNQK
jgi:hypothetical protein